MRFYAYFEGVGEGCDYSIGCNIRLVPLPEEIKTAEEAIEYVHGYDKNGQIFYIGLDCISTVTILAVAETTEVDIGKLLQQEKEAEEQEKREKDEATFEALKKKLGK